MNDRDETGGTAVREEIEKGLRQGVLLRYRDLFACDDNCPEKTTHDHQESDASLMSLQRDLHQTLMRPFLPSWIYLPLIMGRMRVVVVSLRCILGIFKLHG